ncbi:MAG: response regulator [Methylococcaceae bacterium]|nr:response regulator [Methylococcaceae bacterium]
MAKIVLIEDNLANAKLASFLLRSAGHEVWMASDAETGLALVRAERPALVLMDVQLPGMDGLAATSQIKADPAIRHIPVVAITSHAMKGDEETMRAAGCNGYLPKPFHHRELLALVNKILGEA